MRFTRHVNILLSAILLITTGCYAQTGSGYFTDLKVSRSASLPRYSSTAVASAGGANKPGSVIITYGDGEKMFVRNSANTDWVLIGGGTGGAGGRFGIEDTTGDQARAMDLQGYDFAITKYGLLDISNWGTDAVTHYQAIQNSVAANVSIRARSGDESNSATHVYQTYIDLSASHDDNESSNLTLFAGRRRNIYPEVLKAKTLTLNAEKFGLVTDFNDTVGTFKPVILSINGQLADNDGNINIATEEGGGAPSRFGYTGEDVTATANRSFNTDAYGINVYGNSTGPVLNVENIGTAAVKITNKTPSDTYPSLPALIIERTTTNSINTSGFGSQIIFQQTKLGWPSTQILNKLQSDQLTAQGNNATSNFTIIGSDLGVEKNNLAIAGTGRILFSQYGSGTFTGSITRMLGVQSNGIVTEIQGASGTFTSADGKTVTVTSGVITSIQ